MHARRIRSRSPGFFAPAAAPSEDKQKSNRLHQPIGQSHHLVVAGFRALSLPSSFINNASGTIDSNEADGSTPTAENRELSSRDRTATSKSSRSPLGSTAIGYMTQGKRIG